MASGKTNTQQTPFSTFSIFSSETLTDLQIKEFQDIIYRYYKKHKRPFPWRTTTDPYEILVSELMLQQTQTTRVEQKYTKFLTYFPDFSTLATSSFQEVLTHWQGLGYNRRAKALKTIAEIVNEKFHGKLPETEEELQQLPGIGPYTASAILTFAYNKPTIFIETNIRTVFLYFFFQNNTKVSDQEIRVLVKKTLDYEKPREWYYALMDYGVMLKKHHAFINKKSAHYLKQSRFEGSSRQIRGQILRHLLQNPQKFSELQYKLGISNQQLEIILSQLIKENLVRKHDNCYIIAE